MDNYTKNTETGWQKFSRVLVGLFLALTGYLSIWLAALDVIDNEGIFSGHNLGLVMFTVPFGILMIILSINFLRRLVNPDVPLLSAWAMLGTGVWMLCVGGILGAELLQGTLHSSNPRAGEALVTTVGLGLFLTSRGWKTLRGKVKTEEKDSNRNTEPVLKTPVGSGNIYAQQDSYLTSDSKLTKEEQYFRAQLQHIKPANEAVVASGYFRSYLERDASIGAAAQARGYFLALTETNLFVIKTRAPASSRPLLENTGSECIPLDQINEIVFLPEIFGIAYRNSALTLEMKVTNKLFDSQQHLLDCLAEHFDLETRTSDILAEKKKIKRKNALFIVAGISIGVIWALILALTK